MKIKESLYAGDGFFADTLPQVVVLEDFEKGNVSENLSGKALYLEEGELSVFEGKLPFTDDSIGLHLSVWLKVDPRTPGFPWLRFNQFDANGKVVDSYRFNPQMAYDVFKDWVRVEHTFTYKNGNNLSVKFIDRYITVDKLMVRPAGSIIYHSLQDDGRFWLNNYPVEK